MKPAHKKYISQNLNRKSTKEIAKDLGIKERKVRKFLQKQKQKQKMQSFRQPAIKISGKLVLASIIIIVVMGALVYGNSLGGSFIWDDNFLVKNNTYIRNWSYLPRIFVENMKAGGGRVSNFYRPLQMLSYMVDYSIWELNSTGYHLTNTILHIMVALALFWLVIILYCNWQLSLLVSLLFVTHPVHTEAVSYISGRADSLAAIFMFLCFIFYIKKLHSQSKALFIPMILSYILALLSRENSLILIPLIGLYHYSFKKKINWGQSSPLIATTFLYIVLRLTVLASFLPRIQSATTILQRLPGFFVAITNYLRLLMFPFGLHMEYGKKLFSFSNPQAIVGLSVLVLLITYAIARRNTQRAIFFSLCWFLITLLPQSNLYPVNAYMADHWLYVPSVGFFLVTAHLLVFLYTRRNLRMLSVFIVVTLLTFYSYLTIRQNAYWREPIVFFKTTLQHAPDSARVYNSLGLAYQRTGKKQEAIDCFEKAIEVDSNYIDSYNNLGFAYYNIGRADKSITLFNKVIELNPGYSEAYNNLGGVYYSLGEHKRAEGLYKKAIEINPYFADAYNNLGNVYRTTGNISQAAASYKKAIGLKPDYAHAHNNLGNIYRTTEQLDKAVASYRKAIELNPGYALAHYNLALIHYHNNEYGLAIRYCDKAIALGYDAGVELLEALRPYRN